MRFFLPLVTLSALAVITLLQPAGAHARTALPALESVSMSLNQKNLDYDPTHRQLRVPLTLTNNDASPSFLGSIIFLFEQNLPVTVDAGIIKNASDGLANGNSVPAQVPTVFNEADYSIVLELKPNQIEPLSPVIYVPKTLANGTYLLHLLAISKSGTVLAEDIETLPSSVTGTGGISLLDGSLYADGGSGVPSLPQTGALQIAPGSSLSVSGTLRNDSSGPITVMPEIATFDHQSSGYGTNPLATYSQSAITLAAKENKSFTVVLTSASVPANVGKIRLRILDSSTKISLSGSHVLPVSLSGNKVPTKKITTAHKFGTWQLVLPTLLLVALTGLLIFRTRRPHLAKMLIPPALLVLAWIVIPVAGVHANGIVVQAVPGYAAGTTYLSNGADAVVRVLVPRINGFDWQAAGYPSNPCFNKLIPPLQYVCKEGSYASFDLTTTSGSLIPCSSSVTYASLNYATTYPYTTGGFKITINGNDFGKGPSDIYGYASFHTYIFCVRSGGFTLSGKETTWYIESTRAMPGNPCTDPKTLLSYCEDLSSDSFDEYILVSSAYVVNPSSPPGLPPGITLTDNSAGIYAGDVLALNWATTDTATSVNIISDAGDNLAVSPSTSGSINVSPSSARKYHAHACNAFGCNDSSELPVAVYSLPILTQFNGPTLSVSSGTQYQLTWSATNSDTIQGDTASNPVFPESSPPLNAPSASGVQSETAGSSSVWSAVACVTHSDVLQAPQRCSTPVKTVIVTVGPVRMNSGIVLNAPSSAIARDPIALSLSISGFAAARSSISVDAPGSIDSSCAPLSATGSCTDYENPPATFRYTYTGTACDAFNICQNSAPKTVQIFVPANVPLVTLTPSNQKITTIDLTPVVTVPYGQSLSSLMVYRVQDAAGTPFSPVQRVSGNFVSGNTRLGVPVSPGLNFFKATAVDADGATGDSNVVKIIAQTTPMPVTIVSTYFCSGD